MIRAIVWRQKGQSDMLYKEELDQALNGLRIPGHCVRAVEHRHLAFYDIELSEGATVRKLQSRTQEIGLALRAKSEPVVRVLTSQGLVRLQVAIDNTPKLHLFDLYKDVKKDKKQMLPCVFGEKEDGKKLIIDMARNPHLLIAGGTGSGKSVLLHTIITNALIVKYNKFRNINLYLADPKRVEFSLYDNDVMRSFAQVEYDYMRIFGMLSYIREQMETRYKIMSECGIRSIEEKPNLFEISLVVIDEVADLILQDQDLPLRQRGQLQKLIISIAQKARAAGIYMVLSTQRPSRDIITGAIKANFPGRVACRVASRVDSQVVLDAVGAETLLGKGDAIFKNPDIDMQRFQAAYVDPVSIIDNLTTYPVGV